MTDTKYIKPENYIVVQGFMLTELGLKGAELIIYATIYGFCQTEGQCFTGSLSYLCEWTNCTARGVSKCINSLIEKGLIKEVADGNGKRIGYTAAHVSKGAEQSSDINQLKEQSSDSTGTLFLRDRYKVLAKQEQSSERKEQSSEKQEQSSANNIDNILYYNNINNNACARAYDCYEKNIGVIKECVMQEIDSYLADGVEDEMICAAIEDAVKASRFTWHYVNGILLDKVKRNIKTLSAYKADQKAWEYRHNTQKKGFSSSPPQPDADELYRERKPSDEELADYMAMIGGGRA